MDGIFGQLFGVSWVGGSFVKIFLSCFFISRMQMDFWMSLGLLWLAVVSHHDPMLLILNLGVSDMPYIYICVLGVVDLTPISCF